MKDTTWADKTDAEDADKQLETSSEVDMDAVMAVEEGDELMMTETEASKSNGSFVGDNDNPIVVIATDGLLLGEAEEKKEASDNISMAASDEFSFSSMECEDEEDYIDGYVNLGGPFDMDLLRSCIEKGSRVLQQVEGKDVVLVLGKTGVGKSLFIQGVAGKKIVQVHHATEVSGRTVYRNVYEAEDPLIGFDIGHKKVSETRSINCFTHAGAAQGKRDTIYLDSPGFEDTAGAEVDIATSIMLTQVARKAASLKFVVLVNFASLIEDRGGAMRAVLKLAHTFVSDFDLDKKSFMFLFTHASDIDISGSVAATKSRLVNELICILDGTDDPDVKTMLKFMNKSLEKKYPFVDVIHPLMSDFKQLSYFIETKLGSIKFPAKTVNCGLTHHAEMKLVGQLQHMLLKLSGLLQNKAFSDADTECLTQIEDTFRYFRLYISTPKVQNHLNKFTELFERHSEKQVAVLNELLKSAMDSNGRFDTGKAAILKDTFTKLVSLPSGSDAES